MSAPPVTISEDDLATAGQRFGAVLVDSLVLGIPWFLLVTGLFLEDGPSLDVPRWFDTVTTVLIAAYQIVGTALWGQTVGKRVVGIRVCSGQDLGRPGWWRAIRRWVIYAVVGYVPIVGGLLTAVIPLPLLWTTNRQGLHDIFADTLVLRDEGVDWERPFRPPAPAAAESGTGE